MTLTLSHADSIFSYLALCLCLFLCLYHITVIVASYNNDMAIKFHIPLLTLSRKESNLETLGVEVVDSKTL